MQDNWIPWQLPASAKRDAIFVSGSCNCNTNTRELLVDQSCSNQKLMDGCFYWSEWEDSGNRIKMHRILKLDWHVLDIQVNIIIFNQPGYIKKQDIPRKKNTKSSTTHSWKQPQCKLLQGLVSKELLCSSVSHAGLLAKRNDYCPAKQINVNYILPYT